jgi:hypothetical protein
MRKTTKQKLALIAAEALVWIPAGLLLFANVGLAAGWFAAAQAIVFLVAYGAQFFDEVAA